MDRISLRGVRAYGRHGWEARERQQPQPFAIDVDAEIDLAAAQSSDDLAETMDYAALHRRIVAIVERTSYALVERLAADVLEAIFDDARVARASVTIAKPGILDGATPAVTLDRPNPRYGAA
ncbi:MAG TPA: dihydroneopterin aldolase [Candidatus Cybelea sp.]|jgi:dihydroneopterin aldolase|nr:dihydroneopterin aldolase [Candidatus Cybelea sp.]